MIRYIDKKKVKKSVSVSTGTGEAGVSGINGLSAYQIAVNAGFVGNEAAWLLSLKGAKGDTGAQGIQGIQGVPGNDGATGAQGIQGPKGDKGDKGDTGAQGIQGVQGPAASLSSASAFAAAETTISTATYMDIAGCSVSLTAGTWVIFAHVIGRNANAIIQMFCAITHSDNTVIAESAISRPASGTASLNSPVSCTFQCIVTPAGTTTYKLRGARGLTTHTGSWIAMDGNGVNTTNHASNNSDKGTSIIAVKIA